MTGRLVYCTGIYVLHADGRPEVFDHGEVGCGVVFLVEGAFTCWVEDCDYDAGGDHCGSEVCRMDWDDWVN